MAVAGAEFAGKVIRALNGEKGIVVPTFVNLSSDKDGGDALKKELDRDIEYFSVPVELGVCLLPVIFSFDLTLLQENGVEKIKGLGNITDAEKILVAAALPELATSIDKVNLICSICPLTKPDPGRFVHQESQAVEEYCYYNCYRDVC